MSPVKALILLVRSAFYALLDELGRIEMEAAREEYLKRILAKESEITSGN